ncbi:MAG: hypothetical protein H7039_15995 [Bryobacteraceae bacterium]|nr:hypothetical protein [Bryobacteraceae bacterium]
MNLLPTANKNGGSKMVLLAPSAAGVGERLAHVETNSAQHEKLLGEMQRLRGEVYLEDGAITRAQLTSDGRHKVAIDDRSWHVLTLDDNGRVSGCSRYTMHPGGARFGQLELFKSAMASCSKFGKLLRTAVESEMALARSSRLAYVELGGWALSPALRCTTEALKVALATYSLGGLLGGCIGVSTVTVRNHSSSILRRIGGGSLRVGDQVLPRYYDPNYDCDMEILRFDSRSPNAKFQHWIESIREMMVDMPVICATGDSRKINEAVSMLPMVYNPAMLPQALPLSA